MRSTFARLRWLGFSEDDNREIAERASTLADSRNQFASALKTTRSTFTHLAESGSPLRNAQSDSGRWQGSLPKAQDI